jgi:sigma-E factor negative regulatory protein RseC
MIEERGTVVALEPGAIWVETLRHTTCQSCAARKGCGHALIDGERAGSRARIRALTNESFQLHEQVVLGIPEGLLLRGALMVYLLPLMLLFAGALLGQHWGSVGGIDAAAVGGLSGLASGFLLNRWYSVRYRRDPSMHPQVVRRVSAPAVVDEPACVSFRDPA